ncbi:hypothetical protein GCM10022243_67600 [Saccharothrix violaceirubra]
MLAGLPGSTTTSASAINAAGVVVGTSGHTGGSRAVKWSTTGVVTDLGGPADALYIGASAVNRYGVAAGSATGTDGKPRPVRFGTDGTHTVLGTLPGYDKGAFATGVDDNGVVVGQASGRSYYNRLAVRWDANGVPTALPLPPGYTASSIGAISPNGIVTGMVYAYNTPLRAVRWNRDGTTTVLPTLPGGGGTTAASVNRYGDVVGTAIAADGNQHAVRWNRDGTSTDLHDGSPHRGYAVAINDSGVTVGGLLTADGATRPIRWSANGTALDLGVPAGVTSAIPSGINGAGVIVGSTGDDSSYTHQAVKWTNS